MPREAVKTEQLLNIAVKEYDALRKGIDDRADVTKTYGWPVVLLAFGAVAGLKTDVISFNTALTFIPAVVFTIAALDANANHDKARARRALALVEDKIFILSREPLLCHESRSFRKCRERVASQLKRAIFLTFIYVFVEVTISLQLLRPSWESLAWPQTFLFISVLSVPAVILLYSSYGVYRVFTAPLSTLLLEYIEKSKNVEPDGERLLYNTKIGTRNSSAQPI